MKRKKRRVAALLLAMTALAVCDSRWHLEVTEYHLYYDRLPAAFDGLRIVQLSDLHGAVFGRDNRRLIRAVRGQKPDLIAPLTYVSGNHEWAGGCIFRLRTLLARYGVHSLENRYEAWENKGAAIVIAGVDDPCGWADQIPPDALAAQLRREYPQSFVLWLGHRNDWAEKYPDLPVDLILCGHAHGGIVRLPLVGGLLNNDHSLGAAYEAGLYHSGSYDMLVSRGLGNSVPIPRLFNRPEIVTVILHSGQA